jgi:hypothetical protein
MKIILIAPFLTALLYSPVVAKPVVINGNANGLWSPTHPHLTSGRTKPNSPVLYTPPAPEPVVEPETEMATVPDVCPTLQSAPHLCQSL